MATPKKRGASRKEDVLSQRDRQLLEVLELGLKEYARQHNGRVPTDLYSHCANRLPKGANDKPIFSGTWLRKRVGKGVDGPSSKSLPAPPAGEWERDLQGNRLTNEDGAPIPKGGNWERDKYGTVLRNHYNKPIPKGDYQLHSDGTLETDEDGDPYPRGDWARDKFKNILTDRNSPIPRSK